MNMHVSLEATVKSSSGIWGYSTPTAYQTYAIFCVGNDKVREAAFRSWATANGIGFKSVFGCYEGVQEASFIINQKDLPRCFAWYSKEDSVLLLGPAYREGKMHGSREASLYFLETGETRDMGRFLMVLREEALASDAWTYDPTLDAYFVCRHKVEG